MTTYLITHHPTLSPPHPSPSTHARSAWSCSWTTWPPTTSTRASRWTSPWPPWPPRPSACATSSPAPWAASHRTWSGRGEWVGEFIVSFPIRHPHIVFAPLKYLSSYPLTLVPSFPPRHFHHPTPRPIHLRTHAPTRYGMRGRLALQLFILLGTGCLTIAFALQVLRVNLTYGLTVRNRTLKLTSLLFPTLSTPPTHPLIPPTHLSTFPHSADQDGRVRGPHDRLLDLRRGRLRRHLRHHARRRPQEHGRGLRRRCVLPPP